MEIFSDTLMSPLASSAIAGGQGEADVSSRLAQEEEEERRVSDLLHQAVDEQIVNGTVDRETVERGQGIAAKLKETLCQLSKEPEDAAECEAKFELYEGFAKLTENARKATFDLWDSVKDDFNEAAATKATIEKELRNIDQASNLGIYDDQPHGKWFVHSMCRATARNQATIDTVLKGVTSKLELLGSQTECPICFEAFGPTKPSTALSCAHKTCVECWSHWSVVSGGPQTAVCPLCRHEEFLDRVFQAAGRAPPDIE